MLLFSSAYNEYTVISKEYTGPLDFDKTGVDCSYLDLPYKKIRTTIYIIPTQSNHTNCL